jgi:hypothetical protein
MTAHDWTKSTLGHGESMCRRCKITNREAAVLGKLNDCDVPAPQPDAGAMADADPKWLARARERIEASKPFKVGSDIHLLEMAADAYVAATRREAAGFARGVEAAIKAGDSVCDNDQCGLSQRQRAAMRALLGEK